MTKPRHRLPNGRGYLLPEGRIVPGVTTLTKAMDPSADALIGWAANVAAETAVDTREEWDPLDLKSDAVGLIKARANQRRNLQRNVGTATHDVIQALAGEVLTPGVVPVTVHPALVPFVAAYRLFMLETGATFVESEVTVVNRQIGYAGTADAVLDVPDHGRVLADWKTGRHVGAPAYGQVALLAAAETILDDDKTERPWDVPDALWVVQIRPEGYTVHEVPWDEQGVHHAALLAVALVRVHEEAAWFAEETVMRTADEVLT